MADTRSASVRIEPPLVALNLADVERESMGLDVLIVGGGPAGLACALRLAQLVRERSVLLEKAPTFGAHHRGQR